ncbi:MAG: hypothetical protein M3N02_07125 [Pseudomonadota bacterium]|nr:hypothetical protein [Pseudomonadota bacterium]
MTGNRAGWTKAPALRAIRARNGNAIEAIRKLLEGLISTAGRIRKFGLDEILDLVPVAGEAAAGALGSEVAWQTSKLGMLKCQMARIAGRSGSTSVGVHNVADRCASSSPVLSPRREAQG